MDKNTLIEDLKNFTEHLGTELTKQTRKAIHDKNRLNYAFKLGMLNATAAFHNVLETKNLNHVVICVDYKIIHDKFKESIEETDTLLETIKILKKTNNKPKNKPNKE